MDFYLKFLLFFTLMVGIRPQRNSVVHKSRLSSLKLESLESGYDDFMKFLRPIAIPRVSGTENNFKVRNYLISQMQSFGWHIEMDNFTAKTPFGDKPMSNIIATLPIGRHFNSDQTPNPLVLNRVIFACHYDSKYFPNFDFIAATDSAVPCAMLLEMAKFLFENSNLEQFSNLIRHIQFIFFDGEEAFKDWTTTDSLYGSRNYADKLSKLHQQKAFDSMDLFVLMDLFGGDNSKFPNYFPNDPTSRNAYLLMNRIEKLLIKKKALSKSSQYYFKDIQGNGRNFPVDDDHRPFLRKNVPILHLIPFPFPSVWHTQWDTVESLNQDHIQDMRKMMKYFLMEILNKESKKLKENEDL